MIATRVPRITLDVLRSQGVEAPFEDVWFSRLADAISAAHQHAARSTQHPALGGTGAEPPRHPALSTQHPALNVEAVLLLTDDAMLHRLNRDYRAHDRPTDVLSFPQLEDGPGGSPVAAGPPGGALQLGDVAVSVERARRQADDYGHSFERELGYLVVHGLLHLMGYDHEAEGERREMRRVEECALAKVGLTREAP